MEVERVLERCSSQGEIGRIHLSPILPLKLSSEKRRDPFQPVCLRVSGPASCSLYVPPRPGKLRRKGELQIRPDRLVSRAPLAVDSTMARSSLVTTTFNCTVTSLL